MNTDPKDKSRDPAEEPVLNQDEHIKSDPGNTPENSSPEEEAGDDTSQDKSGQNPSEQIEQGDEDKLNPYPDESDPDFQK